MDILLWDGWMQLISESGWRDRALIGIILFACASSFLCLISAALALYLRLRNLWKSRMWQKLESEWERLVMGVLTGSLQPEDAAVSVEPGQRLYFVDFTYRYARRLCGEERDRLRVLAAPFLEDVASRVGSRDVTRRARAIRTLGLLGPQKYRPLIVGALDDPSPFVALIAAHTLALDHDSDAAGALLSHLARFERWNWKFLAALLAGAGARACPMLRDALVDPGRETWQRVVVAGALRELQDPLAGEAAATVLRTAKGRNLAAAMLRVLGDLGGPEHLPLVRRRCAHPDYVVRAQAISALGRLGDKEDLPLLRNALNDPSPWVAMKAVAGLKRIGGYDYLRDLLYGSRKQAVLAGDLLTGGAD